jgi:NAD(P)-dependent dehydrogenase (short-subunit alcohol dehydrogenase family)
MLARNPQRLAALERELPDCKGYACDVSDAAQVEATADRIERDLGVPTTLVHNAVGGAFGSFLEIDPAVLNRNFQVNTMGLLYLARRLAPAMISAGTGNVIVTGNTSALRGKAVLRRVRTNQGRAANPGRSHGPRTWAEGSACRLHY